MPAEFEPHSGCWMLWPERPDNWRSGAKPAQAAFAAIAAAIAGAEPVTVGVSAAQFQNARARLPREVRVVEMSSNDAWIRDCGPTFVIDGKGRRRGVDWTFNAWGGSSGGLYFLNSINPFRLEGQKTVMFEMLEQLASVPSLLHCSHW